jgi:hypothetical protein
MSNYIWTGTLAGLYRSTYYNFSELQQVPVPRIFEYYTLAIRGSVAVLGIATVSQISVLIFKTATIA